MMQLKFIKNSNILVIILSTLLAIGLFFLENWLSFLITVFLLPLILVNIFKKGLSGLYSFVILLASLNPIPNSLDLPVIVFLIICLSITVKFFIDISNIYLKNILNYPETYILLIFLLILLLNFLVAHKNEINFSDWIRGVLPFLFIYIYFFCVRYLQKYEDITLTIVSIVISGAILITKGLYIFISEKLWLPKEYIYVPYIDSWVKAENEGDLFWQRITVLYPQATDVIYIICFFILTTFLVFSDSKKRWILLPMIYGNFFIMIISYSRSFIISIIIGFFVLITLFTLIKKDLNKVKAFLIAFLITAVTVILTVEILNLAPFKNRFYLFALSIKETLSTKENLSTKETLSTKDPNIFSRIEEIKIAFKMFKESPIIGKGFGVKHEIYYDIGFGKLKKFTKQYIHNWFFYFLMTTGIIGTLLYSSIYLMPLCKLLKQFILSQEVKSLYFYYNVITIISIFLLNFYSQMFASFRLIGYNILIGIFLGISVTLNLLKGK